MLSMKDIAAVKFAIEICNNLDLKKEILCAPGSVYDLNNNGYDRQDVKLLWCKIIEKKTTAILVNLGLAKQLREKVTNIVLSVGMQMLLWARYHEITLGLSREYTVKFLKNSFFTPEGMIDNKRAAEELINDESLNIKQKYMLACVYCFTHHIPVLFRQLTTDDRQYFYDAEKHVRIKQPELARFWSYYLMSDVDKLLNGEKNLNQYRLEKAVRSGSKTAVEYCLEKTKIKIKIDAVVDAATEAVRCRIRVKPHKDSDYIFRNRKNEDNEESWVPNDYYVDILCFLLSKMEENQQIEFFRKKIEVVDKQKEHYLIIWHLLEREPYDRKPEYRMCSIVALECFLNWPYQGYFIKKAKLMWEFLPEKDYVILLLMICDKIESNYGEGGSFDYRELLKEFWCLSPDNYKRFVFNNQEITLQNRYTRIKTGVELLNKLVTLKNVTYADGEIIKLILTSATSEEKENILSTKEWTKMCAKLMEEEKWETLDRCALGFLSKEEKSEFKRELILREEVQCVCIDFAKNDKWNAADSFMKWSSLSKEEIKELKMEIIKSDYGRKSCVQILFDKKVKGVEFIRWYLPSDEEVKTFIKELIFSDYGTGICAKNVGNNQELVTEFINFFLSSEDEVRELKKRVAYEHGSYICRQLISTGLGHRSYQGIEWEKVEMFLTWCFASEEEIKNFKNFFFLKCGEIIHFELIESNQFEGAETFFAWLGLSVREIKELKIMTLLDYEPATEMFLRLIYNLDQDVQIYMEGYGDKQEPIELFSRWYFTDKKMVFECKDKLLQCLEDESDLKNFNLIIEQRLKDLDDENSRKKKAENFSPNKRLCTLNSTL